MWPRPSCSVFAWRHSRAFKSSSKRGYAVDVVAQKFSDGGNGLKPASPFFVIPSGGVPWQHGQPRISPP